MYADCVDYNQYPEARFTAINSTTDASGLLGVTCPAGFDWLEGESYFRTYSGDGNITVTGRDDTPAGTFLNFYGGGEYTAKVANDYAAHVYAILDAYIPGAYWKFGRGRPAITVRVSNVADDSYRTQYSPASDLIQINRNRVFTGPGGEDGVFVAVHEFGHAFQYRGIEPWRSYECSPPVHSLNEVEYLSCAFVEGFADFYAAWVAGQGLSSGWNTGYATDNAIEENPFPNYGDGVSIEGAAAAFFYDLVDGSNEPDAADNTANGDEWFDEANFGGPWLVNVMQNCVYYGTDGRGHDRLDGMDHFVYCAERAVSAYNESRSLGYYSWRGPYSRATVSGTQDASYPAIIRRLWRHNFYYR